MTRPSASASDISIDPLPPASSPSYTRLSAALATAQYEAFTNPPSNIFTLFCPLSRTPGVSKVEALEELTARHEAWRQWDTGVWVMATVKKKGKETKGQVGAEEGKEEEEGGEEEEVVGGACCYFNTDSDNDIDAGKNGNANGTSDDDHERSAEETTSKDKTEDGAGEKDDEAGFACWWPAGPGRKIADKLLEKLMTSRAEVVKGPHACTFPPSTFPFVSFNLVYWRFTHILLAIFPCSDRLNPLYAVCEILFTHPSFRNQGIAQRLLQ